MSFLDNLLTLKRPLQYGKEVIRIPRTFSSIFTRRAFLYKAHETKAGLYAVLPHNQDGSLYICPGKGEINKGESYKGQHYSLGSDFYLINTYEQREKGQSMVLGSKTMKSASHKGIKLAVKISVSYGVTQEGNTDFVQIKYNFPVHTKTVQFTVCRSPSGEAVAEAPKIISRAAGTSQEEVLRGVHHEATLENLVRLILRVPLTPQEIHGLYNLNYVKRHVLH